MPHFRPFAALVCLAAAIACHDARRTFADDVNKVTEPTRVRDVIYGRKHGMALTMDVVKPAKPSGIGVMFMVSGGFNSDIEMTRGGLFGPATLKPFIDRGQTIFLVCHGSQPKFQVQEIVPDVQRAVRYIRTHAAEYGVDPERLGVSGASSGGFLSLSIGTRGKAGDPNAKDDVDKASSRVAAVACFFPPTDLVDYGKKGSSFVEFEPVKFVWHTLPVQGKSKEEQTKILTELSPLHLITKDTPPTLIIHGDNDVLVPHEQAERFVAKLDELKIPAKLDLRKAAGHGWPGIEKDAALFAEWFEKYCVKK